jgi:hypothetical protein
VARPVTSVGLPESIQVHWTLCDISNGMTDEWESTTDDTRLIFCSDFRQDVG